MFFYSRWAVALALCLLLGCKNKNGSNELTIAVAAPLSGNNAFLGWPLKNGVELAVNEINQRGGIHGQRVRLRVVDDANDPQQAAAHAHELSSDGHTLVVIGHRTSDVCQSAGKVYAQAGLLAITASAARPEVSAGNPWYFRTAPDTDYQGRFLVQYAKQVLGWNAVRLIIDDSSYGHSLGESFKAAAGPLGFQIEREWNVPSHGDDLQARLIAAGRKVAEAEGNTPIFFAVGEAVAVPLLIGLRDAGAHAEILGGQVLGNPAFNDHFKDLAAHRTQPGFYTDGLIAAAVGLADTAGEAAQRYYHRYYATYHRESDTMAAAYYDAAMLALQGLNATNATGHDIAAERLRLRDWLNHFTSPETSYVGTLGRIFFDTTRGAVKSISIGKFEGGRFVAAPIQLDLIARPAAVPNFDAELAAGRIVQIGGMYWSKVQVVYVGLDVLSISDINTRAGEFTADMYIWFRYLGDTPVHDLHFQGAVKPVLFDKPVWLRQRDKLTVATYRITTTVKAEFDYSTYPFDHQLLQISFRHNQKTLNTFIMATDTRGMSIKDKNYDELAMARLNTSFSGSTWQPLALSFYQTAYKHDSTLGEGGLAYADIGLEYSALFFTLEIKRNFASYFIKNILPLALILIALYMCNFLPPSEMSTQVQIGITALLTCIVLYQVLSSELTGISYLTFIDYVYFAAFALCIGSVSLNVIGFLAARAGRVRVVSTVKRIGILSIPCAVVLLALIMILVRTSK